MRTSPTPLATVLGMRQMPWWLRYLPSRIQFLEDFEGVLKWITVDGTITKDTSNHAFEGSYNLKMATAAVAGADAIARLILPAIPKSKIMAQLRWHFDAAAETTPRFFRVEIELYDGSYLYKCGLQYLKNLTSAQQKWQYLNDAGSYVDLPGGSQNISVIIKSPQFLMLKANLASSPPKYIMAELSELVIDMSTLNLYKTTSSTSPRVNINLTAETDAAAETDAYVDTFCFSDQEP